MTETTPSKALPKKKRLPPEQWNLIQNLSQTLKEDDKRSFRVFMNIIETCGLQRTGELFQKTLEIEQEGGMMLPDGSRRRTPGGVFFYLVKQEITDEQRRDIFYRRNKKAARSATKDQSPTPSAEASLQTVTTPSPAPTPLEIDIPDGLPPAALQKLSELRLAEEQYLKRIYDLRAKPESQRFGLAMTEKLLSAVENQIKDLVAQFA